MPATRDNNMVSKSARHTRGRLTQDSNELGAMLPSAGQSSSYVKICQKDIISMENQIQELRESLKQMTEENKGLILAQDGYIRTIEETKLANTSLQTEIKELQ